MTDATSAAGLLLKLYELRTEPTLRNARACFIFEFHPSSSQDILRVCLGPGHESALGPFIADVRAATKYSDYLQHIERVVQTEADSVGRVDIFGRYLDRQRTLAAEGRQQSHLTTGSAP